MTSKDLVLFLDSVGRTVVGEKVKETKEVLHVKNPSVLHVQPNQENGQIQVQLIPVFFKEFAKPGSNDVVWEYLRKGITKAVDPDLDDRLVTQYNNMYSVIQAPGTDDTAAKARLDDQPVVKLFDD